MGVTRLIANINPMGWSYTINGLDKEFLKNEKAQMASPLSGLMALHFPL